MTQYQQYRNLRYTKTFSMYQPIFKLQNRKHYMQNRDTLCFTLTQYIKTTSQITVIITHQQHICYKVTQK